MVKSIYLWGRDFVKGKDWARINKIMSLMILFAVTLFSIQSTIVNAQAKSSLKNTTCGSTTGACLGVQKLYESQKLLAVKDTGENNSDTPTTFIHTGTGLLELWNNIAGAENTEPMEFVSREQHARALNEMDYFSKVGIYGVGMDSMYLALNSAPSINLSRQLAQDWIPGNTTVYAAESGYDYLMNSGISPIWEKTRNIAYLMFVLVLIVAGFMIMFRHKIGGQAAVTVMNTIPNVLISLILVTFSFAIVGLLMNIGGLLITIIISVLDLDKSSIIYTDGVLSIFKHFFNGGLSGGGGWTNMNLAGAGATGAGIAAWSEGLAGVLSGTAAGATAPVWLSTTIVLGGGLVALVALAIIGIIAWASWKVFFTLLKTYMSLLLDTVMAPIYLAIAAIPGQEKSRNDWFKRILKNILVFPTVFLIVNLGTFIIQNGIQLSFPGILTGNIGSSGPWPWVMFLITRSAIIYLYFLAAQAPTLISDFFPQSGGKGVGEALKSAASGVPLIGGMFG